MGEEVKNFKVDTYNEKYPVQADRYKVLDKWVQFWVGDEVVALFDVDAVKAIFLVDNQ